MYQFLRFHIHQLSKRVSFIIYFSRLFLYKYLEKMTTRSRPLPATQINQPTMISHPYAQFMIDYCNTDEDDSV